MFFYKIFDDKGNENMNEKIDLTELLKDCPLETRFYMSVLGEQVKLDSISKTETEHPIVVKTDDDINFYLSKYGQLFAQYKHGDCVLWPSEECRDWSKFKVPIKKFDPKTLQPFDRVIAKLDSDDIYYWFADFVSMPAKGYDIVPCTISKKSAEMVIPYNEETKHLVGTSDEAPEYYRYWEE